MLGATPILRGQQGQRGPQHRNGVAVGPGRWGVLDLASHARHLVTNGRQISEDAPVSSSQPCRPGAPAASNWRVIVPVKDRAVAKSRLLPPGGVSRSHLAHAMALDTVEAAADAVGRGALTVVTSDDRMAAWALEQGILVVPDPGHGLNAALKSALVASPHGRVAILLGDLPALRSEQLAVALAACARHELALVPDRAGTGTALLTSTGPTLVPQFGPESAQRHERVLGATALDLPLCGLRDDVDTATDLAAAITLGVGRHTQRILAESKPTAPCPSSAPRLGRCRPACTSSPKARVGQSCSTPESSFRSPPTSSPTAVCGCCGLGNDSASPSGQTV